jgi:hypothetical protein
MKSGITRCEDGRRRIGSCGSILAATGTTTRQGLASHFFNAHWRRRADNAQEK